MMDQKFETLLAVVSTLNYTQAAKILHLTQPAISQHISQLEKEYNIKIFLKNGRKLSLTSEGKLLVKYARQISSFYKELDVKLDDIKYNRNSLTIGITHTSESNIIPEVLAIYASTYAGRKIRIISDSIKNLYDKLFSYELDFAVVEGKVINKDFQTILVDTDSLVAVLSNDNPLAKNGTININDLKNQKMILRSVGSATRNLFVSQLIANNITIDDFNVVMEIDNIATIKDLVSKNLFVSILPKSACLAELKNKSLTILPIQNMNMIREINLVYREGYLNKEVLDDLLKIYRETILVK